MFSQAATDIDVAVAADLASILVCVLAAYARYPERLANSRATVGKLCASWIAMGMAYVTRGPRGGVRGVLVVRPEAGAMLIENVAVHPRHQHRGVGSHLMQFAEHRARAAGLSELRLITNPIMTDSVAFYARLGYTEVDRNAAEGFERVYMRKELN